MAIKFISVRCPECGANLTIEEGREKIFCSYCGAQIIMANDNEHIYRHIDEAKIKEAEMRQTVELKKLEIIEKKRVAAEKTKKVKIIASIVMGIVGIVMMLSNSETAQFIGLIPITAILSIWTFGAAMNEEDNLDSGDKIKIPSGISDYEDKSYMAVEAMFKAAGFTNIKCVPLHDLRTGLLKKPDTVESITIDGNDNISYGKKYSPDATVIISYHSFVGR